jgi:hypothetical protein
MSDVMTYTTPFMIFSVMLTIGEASKLDA